MRKIEKEMVKATELRRNWKSGNTEVIVVNGEGEFMELYVKLHGNTIARIETDDDAFYAIADNATWNRYPTRTTASRLRALGFTFNKALNRWN